MMVVVVLGGVMLPEARLTLSKSRRLHVQGRSRPILELTASISALVAALAVAALTTWSKLEHFNWSKSIIVAVQCLLY